jgi:hypothetical protein
MCVSRTRTCSIQTCIALATTKKGMQSVAEYYSKMRGFADELATSGHPLGAEEFVSYLLAGLGVDFNPMVSTVVARVEPITPAELYSHMLSHELHCVGQANGDIGYYSSVKTVVHGRGGPGHSPSRGCGCGCGGGRFPSSSSNNRSSTPRTSDASTGHPHCQVCLRPGHTTNICWYRFDEEYVLEQKTAVAASTSNAQDSNWYMDLGATDHITGELDKLTMHDRYHGSDQVKAANSTGVHINLIGHSIIPTTYRPLHLKNVLHVPRAHKHLVSTRRFNLDNHTFIELHPHCFLIKDQVTKKVLLQGPCSGGLYPIMSHLTPSIQKYASAVLKLSSHHWHNRLGHPSFEIVRRVIKDNNSSCSSLENSGSMRDACMKANTHQLPYPVSTS